MVAAAPPSSANKTQIRALRQLRKHCLDPGFYGQHLSRWLAHKQAQKILVIDGEKLKTDPFVVMNQVQDFLDVEKIDYSELIKFDHKKGNLANPSEQKLGSAESGMLIAECDSGSEVDFILSGTKTETPSKLPCP